MNRSTEAPCPSVPGTNREPTGTDRNRSAPPDLLPVLALLRARQGGAIVADLAAELGASVHLVERYLRHLRGQGLVTSAFEGTPPILHWRAASPPSPTTRSPA